MARNKHEEAADMYRAALQKNPNEFDIIFNAANAFRFVTIYLACSQIFDFVHFSLGLVAFHLGIHLPLPLGSYKASASMCI